MLVSNTQSLLSVRHIRKETSRNNEKHRKHINFINLTMFIAPHMDLAVARGSNDLPNSLNQKSLETTMSLPENHSYDTVDSISNINVPIWQHSWELQYTRSNQTVDGSDFANAKTASGLAFMKEEEKFCDFLRVIDGNKSKPETYECGDIKLKEASGSYWICASNIKDLGDSGKPLFTVPPLQDRSSAEDQDYRYTSDNLLQSMLIMAIDGRATIFTTMQLITLPLSTIDKEELPFRIRVNLIFSVVNPEVLKTHFTSMKSEEAQRRLLAHIFASDIVNVANSRREIDIPFFLSTIRSAPDLVSNMAVDAAQPPQLRPTLLPFQRRSVSWLLEREGKTISDMGQITSLQTSEKLSPLFWAPICISEGLTWYYNRLHGLLSPGIPRSDIVGGILAEEPGLGKTLESIALILLNPATDRSASNTRWDAQSQLYVKETKTTLIVTPQALAMQWLEEFAKHAPTLKVVKYDGWHKIPVPTILDSVENQQNSSKKRKMQRTSTKSRKKTKIGMFGSSSFDNADDDDDISYDLDWCHYINQFDVCITTFNVLQQDLGVARAPIKRPRREAGNYSNLGRSRSPLVMSEWYRVIMDEVQMVGGGRAEEMVGLIPRISSFAVSGTPARSRVADLYHVLKFLRVEEAVESNRIWTRLLKPGFLNEFHSLFSKIAIRTTKSQAKSELTIPEQKRYLVPIELGRIERHVYDQNLEQALSDLGLDAHGVAASEGWQINVASLRVWLRRLRGICTHPQVGQLVRQRDKTFRPGALKTLKEVLDNMKDESWRTLVDSRKAKIQAYIKRAQLIQHHEEDKQRYRNALDVLLLAQKSAETSCSDILQVLTEHDVKGQHLKDAFNVSNSNNNNNKKNPASTDVLEEDVHDFAHTVAGEEYANKRHSLVTLHREYLIIRHRVHFLLGDVYHMLGPSHLSSEEEAYTTADNIRKQLLKVSEDIARRSMGQLIHTSLHSILSSGELQIPQCGKGGIRSDFLLREADGIIAILNVQADLISSWREQIIKLLTADLSAGGDTADGEEYARTLETQGEAEAYLQAYAALHADRRELLVAERTALAAHDAREKKLRHTKAAFKAAAALDREEAFEEAEMEPEHEALRADLMLKRKEMLDASHGRAIKSIVVDLSSLVTRIQSDADPEKIIAKETAQLLRRLITEQTKLHDKMEADAAQFRKTFNDRIEYFRQLQQLSDTVVDVQWEGHVLDAINEAIQDANQYEDLIKRDSARYRYLNYMAQAKEGQEEEEDKACILCRCEFKRGYITQCAHVFCEGCLKAWIERREGKACPVCRVIIDVDRVQHVSLEDNVSENTLKSKRSSLDGPLPKSRRVIQYNTIDASLYKEIKDVECHGDYGTKVKALVQHLLYLQQEEPGAKSIVFSAWADSLTIIEHALTLNGVPSLRIDHKKNAVDIFRSDPNILVLLLHGERENAGLNITCASRVFLVESVVQHSFEMQAIARIDRMGQTRPTEVYCYYAEDTVEKNILDLAARQGVSLYTQDCSSGTLDIASYAIKVDSPTKKSKQKGDFIMKLDDMLAILFPHMFEDLEYLLPRAAIEVDADHNDIDARLDALDAGRLDMCTQPVAGPSRLH